MLAIDAYCSYLFAQKIDLIDSIFENILSWGSKLSKEEALAEKNLFFS